MKASLLLFLVLILQAFSLKMPRFKKEEENEQYEKRIARSSKHLPRIKRKDFQSNSILDNYREKLPEEKL